MTDHTEDKDRFAALRRKAEAKVASLPTPTSETETKRLLYELQVYQVELEMQNEELRQTQEKLAESRNHYADLLLKTSYKYTRPTQHHRKGRASQAEDQ